MDDYVKDSHQTHNYKNNNALNGHPAYPRLGGYNYYSTDEKMDDTRDTSFAGHTTGSTKYLDYPASRPFINTEYTRTDPQVSPHATSDRDAVITALRNLQDKIKNLEIERKAAEKNLHSLTSETEQYKQILTSGKPPGTSWVTQDNRADKDGALTHGQTRELGGQLSFTEHRCQLLEKQLQEMRKLVENSERNQRELMEKMGKTRQDRDGGAVDIRQHIDRLNELERDQTRLTVTQTLAESKIRELEKKIKEEKLRRRTIQDKTAQLESDTLNQKAVPSQQEPSPTDVLAQVLRTRKLTKKVTKKKKKSPSVSLLPAGTCRPEPKRHYRLNLAEIPFVAGKSTGPSHALGANVQKVLAMMKRHNSVLCSTAHASKDFQVSESASSTVSSTDQELGDLLTQLQDEFGQLSSKHQEIVDLVYAARDLRTKEKLNQELDTITASMENKSQQISTIRQHQKKMEDVRRNRVAQTTRFDKPQRAQLAPSHRHHHHYSDNNMIHRSKPKLHAACNKPIGNSALGRPELFMLRDMQKIQSKLRRDDLCWE